MRRILALLLCMALMICIFSGCQREEEPHRPTGDGLTWEEEEQTKPSGTVETVKADMILPYYAEKSMHPYESTDYTNRTLFSLVYQGLFAVDRQYNVWPILCDSYQVSWDMKTYTFHLAQATFSDGSALTANDVVASLQAAMDSDVYGGRFGYVENVTATDDGAVTVTLETPYENFLLLLDVPIVKGNQTAQERPLGTGPYVYQGTDNGLELHRRKDWWCTAAVPATLDKIRLLKAQNPVQLRDEFEFADLSMVCGDPGHETFVDFHSDHELWDYENGIFLYLGCNEKSPVMSEPEIRQALTYAIDRDALVDEFHQGFAYGTVLPASPQSPFYSAALANKYSYTPGRLTQAVTAAGLQDTGVVLLVNKADAIRVRMARAIAASLSQCGLKVTTSELEGDEYRYALSIGKFDLYLGQTKLSPNMDLSPFFSTGGSLKYGGMSDAMMYALCLDALANSGNYYTLHQKVLEDGQLCPILFRSYAVFSQRGTFSDLEPARDNLFFYNLGKTVEEARIEE